MVTPRLLAILGSGETSPTMTSVHADLLRRLPPERSSAVMLDTPYGFQENADEISRRSADYFAHNVGHHIEVLSFRDRATAPPAQYERMCAGLALAGYVFAGPGSPSYALRQWHATRVPPLLAEKLRGGGVVVFSSAAAVGLGLVALPVYEVYKVGEPPRWLEGLDLLAEAGISAAVIPHYNNAEGGTHDTRFCYMGERRLRMLEQLLPAGCSILGVDEHTACIIDLDSRTLSVRGSGGVTWRVSGAETAWPPGTTVSLDVLAPAVASQRSGLAPSQSSAVCVPGGQRRLESLRIEAVEALRERDVDAALRAILAVEASAAAETDGPAADELTGARGALRELITRLAMTAETGAADPRQRVAPLVATLLGIRDRARVDRRFADADELRDSLVAAGIEVHDTPDGSSWELASIAQP